MCQFATKWSDDGTVAEPTFLQEPTFQQSYPWNINDDWSNWCSQILDDVQTISVVSVPQTIPVVSVPQAKSVILKKQTQNQPNLTKNLRLSPRTCCRPVRRAFDNDLDMLIRCYLTKKFVYKYCK